VNEIIVGANSEENKMENMVDEVIQLFGDSVEIYQADFKTDG
jgi:hypothetical protein